MTYRNETVKKNPNAFNPAGSIYVSTRSALRRIPCQRGALLLNLIVGMVAVGLLGAGMIYFTTTSTYGELFANRQARAYYVAEAGGQLAIKLLNENKTSTTYLPPDGAYKLGSNGSDGEFSLTSTSDNTDPDMPRVKVISLGVVHKGTWLEAKKKITYKIPRSNPTAALDGTTDIFFDNGLNDVEDDPTWELVEGLNSNLTYKNGELLIKSSVKELVAVLAVQPEAVDLVTARTNSGELLSYEVQVKVKLDIEGNKGKFFAAGITFRMDTDRNHAYGVSFFRAIADNKDMPNWFADNFGTSFQTLRNGNSYIVLWEKSSSTGKYELIDYTLAQPYGFAVDSWTTFVLNLREECNPQPVSPEVCTGSRQNRIQIYAASSSVYPKGTINWSYASNTNFKLVTWNSGLSAIIDDTWTTGYWSTITAPYPEEVGIHAYYDQPSSNDQYFADFAMRGEGLGGSGGYQY
ncbi:hypothetical protein KN63_06840 [Smithella sp. F21]|nr:hypothetical protein KN63_06840 [Smithella sp. F21]